MLGHQLVRRAGHGVSPMKADLLPSPFILARSPADITITASPEIVHATSKIFETRTVTETSIQTIATPSLSIKTVEQLKTVPTTITVFPKLVPRDDKTITITPPTVYKTTVVKITSVVTNWMTVKSILANVSFSTTTVEKPTTIATTLTVNPSLLTIPQTVTLPPPAGAKESLIEIHSVVVPLPTGLSQNTTTTINDNQCKSHSRSHWIHIIVAFIVGALLVLLCQKAWALFRRWRASKTGKGYIHRKPLFQRTGVVGDIPMEHVSVYQTGPFADQAGESTTRGRESVSSRESLAAPPPAYVAGPSMLPTARRDENGFWTDFKG